MPSSSSSAGGFAIGAAELRLRRSLPSLFPTFFPSDKLVRDLLDRWWSLHVGSRGSAHGGQGAPSGAALRNTVNLALLRAKRTARQWHPGGWSGRGKPAHHQLVCRLCNGQDGQPLVWGTGCPVEDFYRARDRANRSVDAAARYQLHHVPFGWNPKQNPRKDTPAQAKARALWARADKRCDEAEAAEDNPAFGLVVRFLGIVLTLWSVHEDPETLSRYVLG